MANYAAYGHTLRVFDVFNTSAWADVAQVVGIGGPGLAMDVPDATHHASTGAWREMISALISAGEITLDLNYDPGANSHQVLMQFMVTRQLGMFQLVRPDVGATSDYFLAFVVAAVPAAPVADRLALAVTLRPSGAPLLEDVTGFDFLEEEDGAYVLTEDGQPIVLNWP